MSYRSLTWWRYWTGSTLYSLLLFYCFGGIVHRACLKSQRTYFSSVQSLSHVRLSATSWTVAHQASLSITNSRSLLKLMSIELVMPSDHLILCHPLLLLVFNLSRHQGLFQRVSSLHQVAKVLTKELIDRVPGELWTEVHDIIQEAVIKTIPKKKK